MKKFLSIFLLASLLVSLTGCSWSDPETIANDGVFKVAMVPDLGGINDQSFNQSAWEGMLELKDLYGANVSYMEPKQSSDFAMNLDRLSDGDYDLIWGIGYAMSDVIEEEAKLNLDKNFAIADYDYGDKTLNNVTGVTFRSQEASFLSGYVAGKTTRTNKVGFIGGMKNNVIYQFEYGYKAGIMYAAKELNKNIEIVSQYAESFSDAAKGKAIGSKMYNDNCDIIFHAAGGVGYGLIEAAKDCGKFVIGVDKDQSFIAPNNVLTSAVKDVGSAVKIVSKDLMDGKDIGGTTYNFGIREGCVGIPKNNKNMDPKVYEDTMKISDLIKDGIISLPKGNLTIPYNAVSYKLYLEELGA